MDKVLLGKYVRIKTGKLNANASQENGKYPFFTCAKKISRINTWAFDSECVLVAGNGELNVKYYNGKFNAYQRTYVIESVDTKIVTTKYLYYFLDRYIDRLRRNSIGGVIKYIKLNHLTDIKLPLPSIEIQNKIVAILDNVQGLIEKREKTITLYDELLMASFLDMFNKYIGKNTVDLVTVSYIKSGLTKGKKYGNKKTVHVPYMRVANVQDGYLDLKEIKKIEATEDEVKRFSLENDDLLLTEGGDPDKLGRGALWKNEISDCIFQNHIFRVRIKNTNELHPLFLSHQTGSNYGKQYFLKAAKQTTGIASISSTQLKKFPVYKPPYELQLQFVNKVSKIDNIKIKLRKSLSQLNSLLNSLSQKAFKGELEFNTAVDLEVLLENDYEFFKKNSDKKSIELLLERLDKNELNDNTFYEQDEYEKAKDFVFELLKDGKIKQEYDFKYNTVKLTVQ